MFAAEMPVDVQPMGPVTVFLTANQPYKVINSVDSTFYPDTTSG